MDGAPTFKAVEVTDVLAFEGPDIVPGGLDDRVSFLILECVVSGHSEVGEAFVTNVAKSDASDESEDFDSVDLFDIIHGQYN